MVGVWIEITRATLQFPSFGRHSPWWECGLKFTFVVFGLYCAKSLPLVGVWIEIIIEKGLDKVAPVTPLGGSVD